MRLLLCLALLFASSCLSNGVGYRDQRCDPDERLADLLADYDRAGNSGSCQCEGDRDADGYSICGEGGHIVIDCDRVRNKLEALSFEYTRHVPALLANGMISFEERDHITAQRYFDRLFAVQPIHPEAAVMRSRLGLREGNIPAARKLITEHIRHVPDHAGLHEAYAEILFLDGLYDEAREQIGIAEQLGAPIWRMAFNRGLIAETEGDLNHAITMYTVALEIKPDMAQASARLKGAQAVMTQSR